MKSIILLFLTITSFLPLIAQENPRIDTIGLSLDVPDLIINVAHDVESGQSAVLLKKQPAHFSHTLPSYYLRFINPNDGSTKDIELIDTTNKRLPKYLGFFQIKDKTYIIYENLKRFSSKDTTIDRPIDQRPIKYVVDLILVDFSTQTVGEHISLVNEWKNDYHLLYPLEFQSSPNDESFALFIQYQIEGIVRVGKIDTYVFDKNIQPIRQTKNFLAIQGNNIYAVHQKLINDAGDVFFLAEKRTLRYYPTGDFNWVTLIDNDFLMSSMHTEALKTNELAFAFTKQNKLLGGGYYASEVLGLYNGVFSAALNPVTGEISGVKKQAFSVALFEGVPNSEYAQKILKDVAKGALINIIGIDIRKIVAHENGDVSIIGEKEELHAPRGPQTVPEHIVFHNIQASTNVQIYADELKTGKNEYVNYGDFFIHRIASNGDLLGAKCVEKTIIANAGFNTKSFVAADYNDTLCIFYNEPAADFASATEKHPSKKEVLTCLKIDPSMHIYKTKWLDFDAPQFTNGMCLDFMKDVFITKKYFVGLSYLDYWNYRIISFPL